MLKLNKVLLLLSAVALVGSCNGISGLIGGGPLEGDWTIKNTTLVFSVKSSGGGYAIDSQNKDLKGTLVGTKLSLVVQNQIAPDISAKTTFVGDYQAAGNIFQGTYKYEDSLPGSGREGQFTAIKR